MTPSDRARELADELELLREELNSPSNLFAFDPDSLRREADKWEKRHPLVKCPRCGGSGRDPGYSIQRVCDPCFGSGQVRS